MADFEGDFAAQHVGQLVAIAAKVGCRFRAGRCDLIEQHDVVAGSLLSTLSTTNRPGDTEPRPGNTTAPNKRTQVRLADFLTGQAMSRSIV